MENKAGYETIAVTTIIKDFGIPANVLGYEYLRKAVLLTLHEPGLVYSVTKVLYPAIAENFGTTPESVERGIRHAIDLAWGCGNIQAMQSNPASPAYGLKNKPTSARLIAVIADWLRLHNSFDI